MNNHEKVQKISVLLIDDSAAVRGMLRKIIEQEKDMEVIATAINGRMGVDHYKKYKPDIVLLDIEMPEMNGLECLAEIMKFEPKARVVMCSSLTTKGAQASIEALDMGAYDCLAKPTSQSIDQGDIFKNKMLMLIRSVRLKRFEPAPFKKHEGEERGKSYEVRPVPDVIKAPKVIAIGASTGGPNALSDIISDISPKIDAPIFITQHMPAGFTSIMATNLAKRASLPVIEAKDNQLVKNGVVYIAPGGLHMTIRKESIGNFIVLSDAHPVQFCKPSVNVMLDSLVDVYETNILTIIITGMGEDGLAACKNLVSKSDQNILIAQDERSSIVWGMPGAVTLAGLCHYVLPLEKLAHAINKISRGLRYG